MTEPAAMSMPIRGNQIVSGSHHKQPNREGTQWLRLLLGVRALDRHLVPHSAVSTCRPQA